MTNLRLSRAVREISSDSSTVIEAGFSQNTSTPAFRASLATGGCPAALMQTTSPSNFSLSSILWWSVYTFATPYAEAIFSAFSRILSQTATRSTSNSSR